MTDIGGNDEQELIRVERFQSMVDGLQEARGYTTLEAWQLRDVVDGRVSPEASIVYHTVQSFGRSLKPCWPGNNRLAGILKLTVRTVQRSLAQLEAAGWITRERVQRHVDKQFYRVIVCQRSRPTATSHVADTGGVVTSGVTTGGDAARHTNHHHVELPEEQAAETPDVAPQEVRDAPEGAPPPGPDETTTKPGEHPAWAVDLAEELLGIYPHGVRDNGRWRKPSRTEVARKLVVIFKGKRAGTPAHEELAQEIRRGAQAERAVAPPPEDPERRYVKGLEVWLNKRCWTDPPTFAGVVPGGAPTVRPNSAPAIDERARDRQEAEHMQRVIEEQGPQPHLVKRLNLFLARLGEPPKFLNVLGSGAPGGATGGGAPDGGGTGVARGPSGAARAQPAGPEGPSGAPLADVVGRVVGAVKKRSTGGSGRQRKAAPEGA